MLQRAYLATTLSVLADAPVVQVVLRREPGGEWVSIESAVRVVTLLSEVRPFLCSRTVEQWGLFRTRR